MRSLRCLGCLSAWGYSLKLRLPVCHPTLPLCRHTTDTADGNPTSMFSQPTALCGITTYPRIITPQPVTSSYYRLDQTTRASECVFFAVTCASPPSTHIPRLFSVLLTNAFCLASPPYCVQLRHWPFIIEWTEAPPSKHTENHVVAPAAPDSPHQKAQIPRHPQSHRHHGASQVKELGGAGQQLDE